MCWRFGSKCNSSYFGFYFLRQDLAMGPRMALNSWSFCLSFPRARLSGIFTTMPYSDVKVLRKGGVSRRWWQREVIRSLGSLYSEGTNVHLWRVGWFLTDWNRRHPTWSLHLLLTALTRTSTKITSAVLLCTVTRPNKPKLCSFWIWESKQTFLIKC